MRRFALLLVLVAPGVFAEERAFSFTWDSRTLGAGEKELSTWVTPRLLRQNTEVFSRVETRAGLGFGLTSWLDTLVAADVDLEAAGIDTKSADARLTSVWHVSPLKPTGVIGLSLLARGSLGFDSLDAEARLVVDKKLGHVWLALNSGATRSWFWNGRHGIDLRLEQSLGLGYAMDGGVGVAFEGRARTAFRVGRYQGTAFWVGPAMSYAKGPFWFALSVMAQVAADQAEADKGTREPLELRDNERFQGRVVIGFKNP